MSGLLVLDADDAESDESVLRLNRGGPESPSDESLELEPELRGRGATTATASPGVISAFGVPSSELETERRILGGPSPLFEEPEELLDDDAFDELLVSPELDARRSRGRSGSSSPGELLDAERLLSSELEDDDRLNTGLSESLLRDELLLTSSEFDDRRSTGRFGLSDDELPDDERDEGEPDEEELVAEEPGAELPAEVLDEFDPFSGRGNGFVGSSASDATECSSAVPSLTNVIVWAL